MTDTKEQILMTSLKLFAKDGYEAVSVSDIAGELGITKGALYKHYKNKRDIFDSIIERMYQVDAQRAREHEVPEEKYEDRPEAYENISADSIKSFAVSQFMFWTEDVFASNFRKMLTLEQYRSKEMSELYQSCLTLGPVAYMEDIFRQMIAEGILKKAEPKQLAVEFFSPHYLLINASDASEDKKMYTAMLNNHIERFFEQNTAAHS